MIYCSIYIYSNLNVARMSLTLLYHFNSINIDVSLQNCSIYPIQYRILKLKTSKCLHNKILLWKNLRCENDSLKL